LRLRIGGFKPRFSGWKQFIFKITHVNQALTPLSSRIFNLCKAYNQAKQSLGEYFRAKPTVIQQSKAPTIKRLSKAPTITQLTKQSLSKAKQSRLSPTIKRQAFTVNQAYS